MPQKKVIYIGIAVVLFLSILGWYFYRQGKKTVTLQSLPGELPGNPGSGNTNGASNDEIKNVANGLYSDMAGPNVLGHNYEPYNKAVLFNDTDIVKLYNTFNSLYQKDSGQTLTEWVQGEYYYFPDVPGTLLNRLKKLNSL